MPVPMMVLVRLLMEDIMLAEPWVCIEAVETMRLRRRVVVEGWRRCEGCREVPFSAYVSVTMAQLLMLRTQGTVLVCLQIGAMPAAERLGKEDKLKER